MRGERAELWPTTLAAALIVFPIGRGTTIDGSERKVTRWWGWIYRPLFKKQYDFPMIRSVEVSKKLGPKPADRNSP